MPTAAYHRAKAAAFRKEAEAYTATSTSKAKAGLLLHAAAEDAEAARLEAVVSPPPVVTPPPVVMPPPAGGVVYGVDPALVLGPAVPLQDVPVGNGAILRTSTLSTSKSTDGFLLVTGKRFVLSGGCVYVDVPTRFVDCETAVSAPVFNTSAAIQAVAGVAVELLRWRHDGGEHHVRGVLATGGLTVRQSSCTRFGNAAIEMAANADLTVEDCLLFEPSGWSDGDHVDGIQCGFARNVTISRTTVLICPFRNGKDLSAGGSNAPIALWAELGNLTGKVTIDRCRLGGGNFMLYLEVKAPYTWAGPTVVSNTMFDRKPAELAGVGPLYGLLYPQHVPLSQSGNVFEDGTAVVL